MKPKIIQSDGMLHARYALHRQIHAADVYPFSAPNGSKIVVCGHEQGLLFLWRGGAAFKQSSSDQLQRSSSDEDVDMSDEEESESTFPKPGQHTAPIIQTLDLPLSTPVLHISFPKLPQLSRPQEIPMSPKFLQHNLVVALACADGSVRLLTLPLNPPSSSLFESKRLRQDPLAGQAGKGTWGEKMVTIANAHQNIPRGVSIAFASRAMTNIQAENEQESGIDVLLASHSADLSGTFKIHKIPVSKGKDWFGAPEIWRYRPLSAPACNIDLLVLPNGRSGPQLLVGESSGVVRIFECTSARLPSGDWSLSLFAPMLKVSENHTVSLLDVKWVLGGQAIAVLTADGAWGIWNIADGKSARGPSGVRPTPFAITGRVGTVIANVSTKSSNQKVDKPSQLAPMTPGTRKTRQENLFFGSTESSMRRGGISIRQSAGSPSGGETDESLIIWSGDSVVYLPSFRAHWQNKFKGASSVSSTSASGHIRDVPSISLEGEARTAVSAFPSDESSALSGPRPLEILVAGERSLVLSSAHSTARASSSNLTTANQSRNSDQSLLSRGLLDVDGLDRMLDGFQSDRSSSAQGSSILAQKKVLFQ